MKYKAGYFATIFRNMYNEKLGRFFKSKGLKQKEVAEMLGVSPAMMGRYIHGTANIGSEFLIGLRKNFPELDLNYIFTNENSEELNLLNDPRDLYEKTNILNDLADIENRIHEIRLKVEDKNWLR